MSIVSAFSKKSASRLACLAGYLLCSACYGADDSLLPYEDSLSSQTTTPMTTEISRGVLPPTPSSRGTTVMAPRGMMRNSRGSLPPTPSSRGTTVMAPRGMMRNSRGSLPPTPSSRGTTVMAPRELMEKPTGFLPSALALADKLLKTLQAERDEVDDHLEAVNQEIKALAYSNPLPFKLLPPYDLTSNSGFEKNTFIAHPSPSLEEDPFLSPLRETLQQMKMFLEKDDIPVSLRLKLNNLKEAYEAYGHRLCKSSATERLNLLSPVRLRGTFIQGSYRVPQDIAYKVTSMDVRGKEHRENKEGSSSVKGYGGLHFKKNFFKCHNREEGKKIGEGSLNPGMEWGMYSLAKILTGQDIIPGSLLVSLTQVPHEESLEGRRGHQEETKDYLLQVTPTIQGIGLHKWLEKKGGEEDIANRIDPVNLSAIIVWTLLAHPSDAKPDNFMVQEGSGPLKLISIDNDYALAHPLVRQDVFSPPSYYPGVKSILYCLDRLMSKPLAKVIGDRVLSRPAEFFVEEWLALLIQQNERYQDLRDRKVLSEDLYESLQLPLQIYSTRIVELLQDLRLLQCLVRHASVNQCSHHHLLINLCPPVGLHYETLRQKAGYSDAFNWIYHHHNKGSLNSVLNFKSTLPNGQLLEHYISQSGRIGDTHHPQRTQPLEEVLKKVRSQYSHRDEDGRTALHRLLHYYSRSDRFESDLDFFLSQGVHREATDQKGLTILDYACQQGSEKAFIALVNRKCGQVLDMPSVLSFYEKHKNNPALFSYFLSLAKRHQVFGWHMALSTLLSSEEEGIPVQGAVSGKRWIPSHLYPTLFNGEGQIISVNEKGNHKVGRIQQGSLSLYVKELPELPGMEEAVSLLTHLLMGQGAPYGELFRIHGKPYYVSQGIEGQNLHDALIKNPEILEKLDFKSLSQLTLMTMLVNPEDGKPDNYIIEQLPADPSLYRLISIDNDHAFVPAVAKEWREGKKTSEPAVQVKSVLYCLDSMDQPIHPEVAEAFTRIKIMEVLTKWLEILKERNTQYTKLFPSTSEIESFYTNQGCCLRVLFQEDAPRHLYEKMEYLQELLSTHKDNITLGSLLAKLEPWLDKRYDQIWGKKRFPVMERFKEIDGPFYKMERNSFTTHTKGAGILKSQNIGDYKSVLEALRSPTAHQPEAALSILRQIKEVEARTIHEKLKHETSRYNFLRGFDFKREMLEDQKNILKGLAGQVPRRLSFINCSALTDDYLTRTINLGHLVELTLTGTTGVTGVFFPLLAKNCATLKEIYLIELASLQYIHDWLDPFRLFPAPLVWNGLDRLEVRNCERLQKVLVQSSSLQRFALNSRGYVDHYSEKSRSLEAIEIESPKLSHLHLDVGGYDKKLEIFRINAKGLEVCALQGWWLTDIMLYNFLLENPKLKQLNLKGCNNLTYTAERIASIFFDPANINLRSLELSGYKIGDEGAKVLATNTTLRHLNLSKNKISDEGTKALAANTTLMMLDLGHNQVGDEGAKALAANTSLWWLNLHNNKIGDEGAKALATNTVPRMLFLRKNRIGAEGAKVLAANTTFAILDLSGNRLGDKGAKTLATNITSATTLILSGNRISDEGAKALASSTAFTLMLNSNQIGDEGAKALAANTTLTGLDLGRNQIGDEGAKALIANTTLSILNLRYNQIGDEGVKALAANITTEIDLGYNQIREEITEGLATRKRRIEYQLDKIQKESIEALENEGVDTKNEKEVLEFLLANREIENKEVLEFLLANEEMEEEEAKAWAANPILTRMFLKAEPLAKKLSQIQKEDNKKYDFIEDEPIIDFSQTGDHWDWDRSIELFTCYESRCGRFENIVKALESNILTGALIKNIADGLTLSLLGEGGGYDSDHYDSKDYYNSPPSVRDYEAIE